MADDELIRRIATVLEKLGPFAKNTPRESKWMTTEQLANELWQADAHLPLKDFEKSPSRYEGRYRKRINTGLDPNARIPTRRLCHC